jgi:uncharacterized protein YggE
VVRAGAIGLAEDMADIEVTVRGTFSAFLSPQRATVTLTVGHQSGSKSQTYTTTVESANRVTAAVQALSNPSEGPVTWWSSQRLRTWTQKPWNKDGKQLPLVYYAAVGVQARFSDFAALAGFLDDVVPLPGVAIDGIAWSLTAVREQEMVAEARNRAVQDAVAKAADYAGALGLHSVLPLAVADVGMLGGDVAFHGGGPSGAAYSRGSASGDGTDPLRLEPEDVEICAQVDARFVAR